MGPQERVCASGTPLVRAAPVVVVERAAGPRVDLLATFEDALLGTALPERSTDRAWGRRYLLLAGLLAAIVVCRRPDTVSNPQFWHEDGLIFFYDNLTLGLAAFGKLYQGFPYVVPRLIAMVGGWFPLAETPRVYTTMATIVTSLGLATFSLPGFRHLVRSDGMRAALCVACVCYPADQEILGTPTGLGWQLAIWLFLISVMRLPRQPWRVASLAVGGALAVLSTPAAALMTPLWALRVAGGSLRRDWRQTGFAATLLGTCALVLLSTGNLGAKPAYPLDLPGSGRVMVAFSWPSVLNAMTYAIASFVVPQDVVRALAQDHLVALRLAAGGFAAALVGVAATGGRRRLIATLTCLCLAVGTLAATLYARPGTSFMLASPPWQLPRRYVVLPTVLLLLGVIVVLDEMRHPSVRRGLSAVACAVVAWAWLPSFAVPPLPDGDWPWWAAQLEAKLASGSRAPLVIPLNPPVWSLRFDADPPRPGAMNTAPRAAPVARRERPCRVAAGERLLDRERGLRRRGRSVAASTG